MRVAFISARTAQTAGNRGWLAYAAEIYFSNARRICGKSYAFVVVGYAVMQEHVPKGTFSEVRGTPQQCSMRRCE